MRWEEKKDGQGLFEQLRGPVEFSAKDEYIIVWRGGGRETSTGYIELNSTAEKRKGNTVHSRRVRRTE